MVEDIRVSVNVAGETAGGCAHPGEAVPDRPLCKCHGEPKHKNGFSRTGTRSWRCAVDDATRGASYYKTNREAILVQLRDRYADDLTFRVRMNLKSGAYNRAAAVARAKTPTVRELMDLG